MLLQRRNGADDSSFGTHVPGLTGSKSNINLELPIDVIMLVGSTWYTIVAFGYPSGAGRVAGSVSSVMVIVAIFRVIFDTRKFMNIRSARHSQEVEFGAPESTAPEEGSKLLLGETAANSGFQGASFDAPLLQGAVATVEAPEYSDEPQQGSRRHSAGVRELVSLGWFAMFILSTVIFGFRFGIPLAGGIYSLVGVRWSRAWQRVVFVAATVIILYLLIMVFIDTLHYTFSGII